jgi:hypothetical protein
MTPGVSTWINSGDAVSRPAPWRSQLCHAFAEPSGYRRTRKDMVKSAAEYRRTLEKPLG